MQVAILDYSVNRVHLINVPDDIGNDDNMMQYLHNKYNYWEDEIYFMSAGEIDVVDER